MHSSQLAASIAILGILFLVSPVVPLRAEQDPAAPPAADAPAPANGIGEVNRSEPAAPPAPPPAPAAKQRAPTEASLKARRERVRKQAMFDPVVKEAFQAAGAAKARASQQEQLKMREIDLSIAPLLDKKDKKEKKAILPADRQKIEAAKAQAAKDPQVRAAAQQASAAIKSADQILAAKIKEIDSALDADAARVAAYKKGKAKAAAATTPATPPPADPTGTTPAN